MWSKLLSLAILAAFLLVVGNPVTAHDGRISNLIDDPDETDEHPWGGENQMVDDPELVATQIDGSQHLFVRIVIKRGWISFSSLLWDVFEYEDPADDIKSGTGVTPTTLDNNNNITDQGTRDM